MREDNVKSNICIDEETTRFLSSKHRPEHFRQRTDEVGGDTCKPGMTVADDGAPCIASEAFNSSSKTLSHFCLLAFMFFEALQKQKLRITFESYPHLFAEGMLLCALARQNLTTTLPKMRRWNCTVVYDLRT